MKGGVGEEGRGRAGIEVGEGAQVTTKR